MHVSTQYVAVLITLTIKNYDCQNVTTIAKYPRKSFFYFFPRQTYPNLFFNLLTNMKKRSETPKKNENLIIKSDLIDLIIKFKNYK